jgi:hypothetical protein
LIFKRLFCLQRLVICTVSYSTSVSLLMNFDDQNR